DPRRAYDRPRSGAGRRDPRPGARAARQPHGAVLEPHPLRGRGPVRAGGRDRPRSHRRRGAADGAQRATRPQPARGHLPRARARGARLVTLFAVAGKELVLYFTSLLFYALASVFLVLSGWLFYTNLDFYVRFGGMNLVLGLWQYQFYDMRQLLLVLVPLITMRLFAEERRLGTLELLWTYPLRDVEIVAGKYLACLVVLAAIVLPTLAYPCPPPPPGPAPSRSRGARWPLVPSASSCSPPPSRPAASSCRRSPTASSS